MSIENICNFSITLQPIHYDNVFPQCKLTLDHIKKDIVLKNTTTVDFQTTINQDTNFVLEFYNKTNNDSIGNRDLRIEIEDISLMGISDKRFIYSGEYFPTYPEPWASQQRAQSVELQEKITNNTSLGWNGQWIFKIGYPVFTHIHKVLNLGNINPYDHINK